MPRGDGTGPAGRGPMTGRAAGYCAGYDAPGFADALGARGRAGGAGAGRGVRAGAAARAAGAVGVHSGAGPGRGYRRMYYATGLPGWMRCKCPGWAAWKAAPGTVRLGMGLGGARYEDPRAGDDAAMPEERERAILADQAQFLRGELEIVERRIEELAGGASDESSGEGPKSGPDGGR